MTGEKIKHTIQYYKSIPTDDRIYNKVVIKGRSPRLDFKKAISEIESSSEDELTLSSMEEDAVEEESKENEQAPEIESLT